jgi:hypothetical protein
MLDLALIAIAEFLGITPARLYDRWKRFNESEDESRKQDQRRARSAARSRIAAERLDTALLESYYPESDLNAAGFQRYSFRIGSQSVTANLITRSEWTGTSIPLLKRPVVDTLRKECPLLPEISDEEKERILFEIVREGRRADNNPLFELVDFDLQVNHFRTTFCICNYFTYLTTLGVLEDELAQALINSDFEVGKVIGSKVSALPNRGRFLPNAETFRECGLWRCVGGVCVLFAIRRPLPDNDYVFIARRRSSKVATGRERISLVPEGIHQPMVEANAKHELRLENTVFREIYEELFKGEEVERSHSHIDPEFFFDKCPALKWFKSERNRDKFHMEVVNFGFELARGNYVFGILLTVDDPEYYVKYKGEIEPNWEFSDPHLLSHSTRSATELAELLREPSWVDHARVTLIEGLKRLKEIDPLRVSLPDLTVPTPPSGEHQL